MEIPAGFFPVESAQPNHGSAPQGNAPFTMAHIAFDEVLALVDKVAAANAAPSSVDLTRQVDGAPIRPSRPGQVIDNAAASTADTGVSTSAIVDAKVIRSPSVPIARTAVLGGEPAVAQDMMPDKGVFEETGALLSIDDGVQPRATEHVSARANDQTDARPQERADGPSISKLGQQVSVQIVRAPGLPDRVVLRELSSVQDTETALESAEAEGRPLATEVEDFDNGLEASASRTLSSTASQSPTHAPVADLPRGGDSKPPSGSSRSTSHSHGSSGVQSAHSLERNQKLPHPDRGSADVREPSRTLRSRQNSQAHTKRPDSPTTTTVHPARARRPGAPQTGVDRPTVFTDHPILAEYATLDSAAYSPATIRQERPITDLRLSEGIDRRRLPNRSTKRGDVASHHDARELERTPQRLASISAGVRTALSKSSIPKTEVIGDATLEQTHVPGSSSRPVDPGATPREAFLHQLPLGRTANRPLSDAPASDGLFPTPIEDVPPRPPPHTVGKHEGNAAVAQQEGPPRDGAVHRTVSLADAGVAAFVGTTTARTESKTTAGSLVKNSQRLVASDDMDASSRQVGAVPNENPLDNRAKEYVTRVGSASPPEHNSSDNKATTPEAPTNTSEGSAAHPYGKQSVEAELTPSRMAERSAPTSSVVPRTPASETHAPRTEWVTLRVDEQGSEGARIRVAVRGSVVNTTIVDSDERVVESLRTHIHDLHNALAQKGFTESRVSFRSPNTQSPLAHLGVHSPASGIEQSDARALHDESHFANSESDDPSRDLAERREHGRQRRSRQQRERQE